MSPLDDPLLLSKITELIAYFCIVQVSHRTGRWTRLSAPVFLKVVNVSPDGYVLYTSRLDPKSLLITDCNLGLAISQ